MTKFKIITALLIFLVSIVLFLPIGDYKAGCIAVLFFIYLGVIAFGVFCICSVFFVPVLCKEPSKTNMVAITYDDGPHPGTTEKLLEVLESYNARSTFFLKGENVKQFPAIARKIVEKGHVIGNHSYDHKWFFPFLRPSKIHRELLAVQQVIDDATGHKPVWFRPPFGVLNPNIAKAVNELHLQIAGWSIRTFDTAGTNREKIFAKTKQKLRGGDIILLHDYSPHSVWLTRKIAELASSRNLKLVTIDELFSDRASKG